MSTFLNLLSMRLSSPLIASAFAYLKEAFVSSLVLLAGYEGDKPSFATVLRDTIKSLRKQLSKDPLTQELRNPLGPSRQVPPREDRMNSVPERRSRFIPPFVESWISNQAAYLPEGPVNSPMYINLPSDIESAPNFESFGPEAEIGRLQRQRQWATDYLLPGGQSGRSQDWSAAFAHPF